MGALARPEATGRGDSAPAEGAVRDDRRRGVGRRGDQRSRSRARGANRAAAADDREPRAARGAGRTTAQRGRGDAPPRLGRARRAPGRAGRARDRAASSRGGRACGGARSLAPQAGARSRRAPPGRGRTAGGDGSRTRVGPRAGCVGRCAPASCSSPNASAHILSAPSLPRRLPRSPRRERISSTSRATAGGSSSTTVPFRRSIPPSTWTEKHSSSRGSAAHRCRATGGPAPISSLRAPARRPAGYRNRRRRFGTDRSASDSIRRPAWSTRNRASASSSVVKRRRRMS